MKPLYLPSTAGSDKSIGSYHKEHKTKNVNKYKAWGSCCGDLAEQKLREVTPDYWEGGRELK